MARAAAGRFDRRIHIQEVDEQRDAAGDVLRDDWTLAFKLWAELNPRGVGIERSTAGGIVRDSDVVFRIRDSAQSRRIAPELHRVLWKGRIYELVGVTPDKDRNDCLLLLCSTRPDQRGSRGDVGVDDGP